MEAHKGQITSNSKMTLHFRCTLLLCDYSSISLFRCSYSLFHCVFHCSYTLPLYSSAFIRCSYSLQLDEKKGLFWISLILTMKGGLLKWNYCWMGSESWHAINKFL